IFQDASGWNYGHLDDPQKPEYNFRREVDYCSGACLVLPRKLFEELGGFDELFAPAYYEDTDLAFRLRAKGWRVVYQPRALVYHFEGASCGRDLSSGLKRYQEINRKKFYQRWQEVLTKRHFPSGPEYLFVARERLNRGIILVADHYVPLWDQDSGSLRLYLLLQIFRELGFKVIFWPDNLAPLQPYTQILEDQGVEVIYGPRDFQAYLKENARFIDLLWACRVRFAPSYLPPAKKEGLNTVFDTIDLHFLREKREAELKGDEKLRQRAEETRRLELSLARAADQVIVVSPFEEEILRQERIENVTVIPNIHEPVKEVPGFEGRKDLMFIGSFQHPPNEDAVCWFVAEIWPRIKKELPEVKFYIVGSSPTEKVKALAREDIIVTGYVPEVAPYFKQTRVFVAPLRYGAGLKGKVGQAMAFGLPSVLTSVAAEGLGGRPGEEYLLADEPEEFAAAVIRLYQDRELWEKLSKNSLELIARRFSREAIKKKVAKLLKDLVPSPKYQRFL
ncbi:MAG TPA: glycosyltransferase, partial [Thermodesulfatator sp.]|nr:glycosyltransferase [Thermodesulfatator sp.]